MLSYSQYYPSTELANYIDCYWVFRAPFMSLSPLERLIPGGRTELILNLGDPMQFLSGNDLSDGIIIRQTHVMGQRSRIYYTKQTGDTHLLGVRFKPGGISAFTKVHASVFLNHLIAAEDVLGTEIKFWEERLLEKPNDSDRINLLDRLLMQTVNGTTAEWASCHKAVDISCTGWNCRQHCLLTIKLFATYPNCLCNRDCRHYLLCYIYPFCHSRCLVLSKRKNKKRFNSNSPCIINSIK